MTRYFGTPVSKGAFVDISGDSDDGVYLIDTTEDDDNISEATLAFDDDDLEGEDGDFDTFEDFFEELTLDEFNTTLATKSAGLGAVHGQERSHSAENVLPFEFVTLDKLTTALGVVLKPGITVELAPDAGLDPANPDFLRVESILQNVANDEVLVRGTRFRRTHRLHGMLEKKANEVFMCQRFDKQDDRSIHAQSLEDILLCHIICERTLILTNQPYPALSWRELELFSFSNIEQAKTIAQLVCRYKYTTYTSSSIKQKAGRILEWRLERLTKSEADKGYAVSDPSLRAAARSSPNKTIDLIKDEAVTGYRQRMNKIKERRVKGECGHSERSIGKARPQGVIDLDTPEVTILDASDEEEEDVIVIETVEHITRRNYVGVYERSVRNTREEKVTTKSSAKRLSPRNKLFGNLSSPRRHDPNEPYTYADAFCGAGGDSCGARIAGLTLKWAFDHWMDACQTYRLNFPSVRVHKREAFNFITGRREIRMVDVLHLSPPCQKWSPAHTIPGKDDDANEASLFAVGCLVQKTRPRIVTLEETAGLQTRHPVFLYHLIQELTLLGYSVRWRIMDLSEYGLSQPRKRLVIIASCPGEPLPPFPEPTHGPGLRPYTTIHDAIHSTESDAPNHEPQDCVKCDSPSYNPHTQLRGCITCSGGESNLHPSGKRRFTNRELASLQGFPHDHVFLGCKSSICKQIGNAVPPVFSHQLYKTVIETLRATDAAEAREGGAIKKDREGMRGSGFARGDVIMLD